MMDGAKLYRKACLEIVHRRAKAMIEGLGLEVTPNTLYNAYYGLIDFEFFARKNIGEDAVEYLKKNVHPLDLAFRLAEDHGIVLLNAAASRRQTASPAVFVGQSGMTRSTRKSVAEFAQSRVATDMHSRLRRALRKPKRQPRDNSRRGHGFGAVAYAPEDRHRCINHLCRFCLGSRIKTLSQGGPTRVPAPANEAVAICS